MNKLALVCLQTTLSRQKVNKSIMRANTRKSNSKSPFSFSSMSLQVQKCFSSLLTGLLRHSLAPLHEYSRTCWRKTAAMMVKQPWNDFIINPTIPLCLRTMSTCTWGSSGQIPNDKSLRSAATATYWTAKQWIYPICPSLVKLYMH